MFEVSREARNLISAFRNIHFALWPKRSNTKNKARGVIRKKAKKQQSS